MSIIFTTPIVPNVTDFVFEKQSVAILADANAMTFKPDGTRIYLATFNAASQVAQYDLDTPWDVASINLGSKISNTIIDRTNVRGLRMHPDGSRIFYTRSDGATIRIYHWILPTPWSIAGATTGASSNIQPLLTGNDARGLFVKPDGTRVWVDNIGFLREFDASVPYAMNSLSCSGACKFADMVHVNDVFFTQDGKICYTCDVDNVFQWNLSTAWDISTITPNVPDYNLSVSANTSNARAIYVRDDGNRMYLQDDITDRLLQYKKPGT